MHMNKLTWVILPIAAQPRRGRFIVPIADLSAPRDDQMNLLNSIIAPQVGVRGNFHDTLPHPGAIMQLNK